MFFVFNFKLKRKKKTKMPNNYGSINNNDQEQLISKQETQTTTNWKPNWWNYGGAALELVRAFSAGATTHLLHNARKISQAWNLTNALCRGTFGAIFELSKPSLRNQVWLEIWKIVCNGSYVITTVDVNKLNTIFNDNHDYNIDEFPNLKLLSAFEISTTVGV